jgi:WNK lysine deficient protein kinase
MSEAEDFIVERSPDGRYSRFNQQLGHGAFKAVFKGYDEEEGIEVAWCQVNMDRVGEAEKTQIHTEVDLLRSLTHKV